MFHRATLSYFCAPVGHYWEWDWIEPDGSGASAVWSDGRKTIALREELTALLESLAREGLPPLGAVLILLDTVSDDWNVTEMRDRIHQAALRASDYNMLPPEFAKVWRHAQKGLETIHQLPKDLRQGFLAKKTLFKLVFEGAFNRLPAEISEIALRQFKETPYLLPFRDRTPVLNGASRILRDLLILEKAFAALSLDQLENRLRTGIDSETVAPAELPEEQTDPTPVPEVPSDLLEALEKEGGELAQIAGLVRRLSAILHVPKPVTSRDDLPVGGVSDITNRGDPSRLLMTELAWDDMTFAVRLAQGEALYMRRESPPAEPPPLRTVLLDTGIFLWGKPRLFALGTALALLRQKDTTGRVLTLKHGTFMPITLATVDDVRAQLMQLEPAPHPGTALTTLFAEADVGALSAGEELFLITHPSSLEPVLPLPVWQDLAGRVPLHSLQVNGEGELALNRHSRSGSRLLAQAKIDLDRLLDLGAASSRKPSDSLTHEAARLPQFYRENPWPLYHPAVPDPGRVYAIHGGYVGVSVTGCVCFWTSRGVTGRVLYPEAPAPNFLGVVLDPEDNDQVICIFRGDAGQTLHMIVSSLKGSRESRLFSLSGKPFDLWRASVQNGALVLHGEDSKAISLIDGTVLAVGTPSPHGSLWYDGERFQSGDGHRTSGLVKTVAKVPRKSAKRHRIDKLFLAGFGLQGGLLIQKEKGRQYQLILKEKGGLEWRYAADVKGTFRPLNPVSLPDWPKSGLTQAEFPDGRRIVYDPRGFLHVIESSRQAHELSLVLVRGETAAWQRTGFFYGDPTLLWGEPKGATQSLKSVCQSLFRSCVTAPKDAVKTSAF